MIPKKEDDYDKRGKAQGVEVEPYDLPMHLQTHQLRKWLKELEDRVAELERDASDPVKHNIRIGGSR